MAMAMVMPVVVVMMTIESVAAQGTFGATIGASTCKECGASSFAPMRGLSQCQRCPNHTITRSMTSHSLVQCECSSESYHKTAMQGEPCDPCPLGSFCAGGVQAPVTRT
eukprot:2305029-Rhodomonas_salina.2